MRLLPFTKLHLPRLLSVAKKIPPVGYIQATEDNLIYLDVDDAFVHSLFPLLHHKAARKPNYFEENLIGAHISVIYPEEARLLRAEDSGQEHRFSLLDVYSAELDDRLYFVLMIESPSLVAFRQRYGLEDQPTFKQHRIKLHITIGVL